MDVAGAVNQADDGRYESPRIDGSAQTQSPAKLRVYVSSTFQDLQECRAQVRVALQRLGVDDVAMETYVAEEARPVDRCVEDVRSCDVYVGLFAWRYGHVLDGYGKSITELEYEAAGAAGITRLIFLHDEQAPWPPVSVDRGAAFERIEALRAYLRTQHVCDFFSNADDLRSKVAEAVSREIQRRTPTTPAPSTPPGIADGAAAWATYKRRLLEEYRRLDLDALTPPEREEYLQIGLREVFVEPNVREDVPPPELPKELLAKLQGLADLDAADIPQGIDRQDLERTQQSYRSRPAESAFDVIRRPGNGLVVLLGDPGAGKSTLARYVALTLADDRADERLAPLRGCQPVLVELRDYALSRQRYETFAEYLTFRARSDGLGISGELFDLHLRSGGRVVVILDGLDELFDPRERESVSRQIAGFASAYPSARVLVTSRVIGYRPRILREAGFRHYTIQDLDPKQIDGFLASWYRLALHDRPTVAAERRERLAKAIRESPSIRELAGNPLLLTILAIIGKHQELPRERWKVYDHAASVLVQHWDVNKHLQDARVDAAAIREDDKKELLRRLAYRMQTGEQGLAGNHLWHDELAAEIEDYLKARFKYEPAQAAVIANAMIDQFRERNFVLARYGSKIYGFVHRALLEFFCAGEIVARFEKTRALTEDALITEVFGAHWEDLAWTEVLRLIAGMVDVSIADRLIAHLVTGARPLRSSVLDQPPLDAVALAAQCLVEVRNLNAAADGAGHTLRALIETLRRPSRSFADDRQQRLEQTILPAVAAIGARWPDREAYLDWFRAYGGGTGVRPASQFAARFAAALFPDSEQLRADLAQRARTNVISEQRHAAALGLAEVWTDHESTLDLMRELAEDPIIVARRAAIEAMSEHWSGDPKVLAALHQALFDYDEGVRKVALMPLSTHWPNDPDTLPAVRRAMADHDEEVREAGLRALVTRWADQPETLTMVHGMLRHDPNWNVRKAALDVLVTGWADHEETLPLVRRAASEVDEEVREAAIEALVARWADHAETLPVVRRAVRDVDDGVRRTAIELLAGRWPDQPETARVLAEACRDHDGTVRHAALRMTAITAGSPGGGLRALRQAIHDPDPEVRKRAVSWLAANRDEYPDTLAAVSRAVLDPGVRVRRAALAALAEHWPHHPETRRAAMNAVRDPDWENRKSAIQVLAKYWGGEPELASLFLDAAHDQYWSTRQVALEVLSSLHADRDEARRVLCRATRDSVDLVRQTALEALIADPRWSEHRSEILEVAMRDTHSGTRTAAHNAVNAGLLTKMDSRAELMEMTRSSSTYLRECALFGLVARAPQDPEIWNLVEQSARDSDADVRRSAFDLIVTRRWDTPAAKRVAFEATRDPDKNVRFAAIRCVLVRWPDEVDAVGLPRRALFDKNELTRWLAVQTLILRRPDDPLTHADLARLDGDSERGTRALAYWQLVEYSSDDGAPSAAFRGIARSATDKVRADAIMVAATRWPDSPETLALIRRGMEDREFSVRKRALELSLSLRPRSPETRELVERACWDPELDLRRFAHRVLVVRGERPDPVGSAEAFASLRDLNPAVRLHALEALLIRWPDAPQTRTAVRLALGDVDAETQLIAADAVCLRWVSDSDVPDTIVAGLQQPGAMSRYSALRILNCADVDPAVKRELLRDATRDQTGYVRTAALNIYLATWPDADETRQVVCELAVDPDEDVRLAPTKCLVEGWPECDETWLAVIGAARDPDGDVRRFALEALAMYRPDDPATAGAFARARRDPSDSVRALAWQSAVLARRPVREFTRLCRDFEAIEWSVRYDALSELVERFPDHADLPAQVLRALEDPAAEIRALAVETMAKLWPRSTVALPAVLAAADDSSLAVRRAVIVALADGWPDEEGALETVLRLSADSYDFNRAKTIQVLARRWPERFESDPDIMLKAVHDVAWRVRYDVINIAVHRELTARAVNELRRCAADATPGTRAMACRLIAMSGSALPNDLSALLALYRGANPDLVAKAAYQLVVCWSDRDEVLPVLHEIAGGVGDDGDDGVLDRHDRDIVRIIALDALVAHWGGHPRTLPLLYAALESDCPGVREAAMSAFGLPRYAELGPPVFRSLLRDDDVVVRWFARVGLIVRGCDADMFNELVRAATDGAEPYLDRFTAIEMLVNRDIDAPEVRSLIEQARDDASQWDYNTAWLKWLHEGLAG